MRPLLLVIVALVVVAVPTMGWSQADDISKSVALGAPTQYANLALIPVAHKGAPPSDSYLTLDEAFDKGVIKVTEYGGSTGTATVNTVHITNDSDIAIFILAGEVILGGKQDRIIGKNTIIPPKKKLPVEVFCVEQGRWDGKGAKFGSGKFLGHSELRKSAQYADQSEVWATVAEANDKLGTQNATSTYQKATKDTKVLDKVGDYVDALLPGLLKYKDSSGMIVVMGGKVIGMELYYSPALFKKLAPKLVAAYAMDAITSEALTSTATISKSEGQGFLDTLAAEKASEEKAVSAGDADNTYFESDSVKQIKTKKGATKVMEQYFVQ